MGRRAAVAAAISFFGVLLVGAPVTAQTEPAKPAPKLAFAGHAKPVLRLVDGDDHASTTVVLSNTGNADATGVIFRLLDDDSAAIEACAVEDVTATGVAPASKSCPTTTVEPITVEAGGSKRLALTFRVEQPAQTRDPLLQAQSSAAGVASAVAETTMSRELSDRRLWLPLVAALVAGVVFLLLGIPATKEGRKAKKKQWKSEIYTAAAWKFGDSWATNIAALGGILGTVLAATGFFGEVLPGVSPGRFTGFSLVFSGLALMAPIVYTVLSRQVDLNGEKTTVGTVGGLLVASSVTVAAVGGELATLGLLVGMSDASTTFQGVCILGLTVAALIVIAYAVRGAAWLSLAPAPKPKPADGTAGSQSLWVQSQASALP